MGQLVGAAHPPADLVELGEPEGVGPLDDQRVRLRDVEAGLDDRRRDEHVGIAAQEREHPILELLLAHLPVRDDHAEVRGQRLEPRGPLVDRLHPVVEEERLSPARDLPLQRLLDQLLVELADVRPDRAPALGRCLDDRDVPQARERHVECARDRRRRQREDVDLEAQLAQQLLLRDAEALLLVHDHEPEVLRDHVSREHSVRPDQDVHLALREVGEHLLRLLGAAEARDHLDAQREVAVALAEGVPVLLGEHGRRDEHQGLLAVQRDGEGCADGDLRLAEADVAADEPVHRPRRLEVFLDGLDRDPLVVRLLVREARLELLEVLVLEVVRDARRLLPLGVEAEELAGELTDALARPALEQLPRLAAELRERRRAAVRADVARDLPELLVRDVEPVVPAEGEQEVVARDARDLLRLEAEQLPDAVVLVDDVVAGAEVGEGLERPADPVLGAARLAPEDLRVRQEREAEVAPDEAAAGRRDRVEELGFGGKLLALLEEACIDTPEQVLVAQRLAAVREGDDRAQAAADERRELLFRLGEAAGGDRRPLRLERDRLSGREGVELGGALERLRRELLFLPDRPHCVRLPDEVGRPRSAAARGRPGSGASSSSGSVGSARSARRSAAG